MPNRDLFSVLFDRELSVYAMIDAAKIEELTTNLLIYEPNFRILFEGENTMALEEVAPYIVQLHEDDLFSKWVIEEVYGHDGAIFLQSHHNIDTLSTHFKGFLHVSREIPHPETKQLVIQEGILAFYDPRVLPEWLESLEEGTKKKFLSVFESLYYEDIFDKSLLCSYESNGIQHQHHLKEV